MLTEQQAKELYDKYIEEAVMYCRISHSSTYDTILAKGGYLNALHRAFAVGEVLGIKWQDTSKKVSEGLINK